LTQSQADADERDNGAYNPNVDKGKKVVFSKTNVRKKEPILISDDEEIQENERPKRKRTNKEPGCK